MIAFIKRPKRRRARPAWHAAFLTMLPAIVRYANVAFRFLPPDAREEAVQEVVCNCLAAFVRLVHQGRQHVAPAGALARFAVAQIRDGRRVGGRRGLRDVMSACAQYRKRFEVDRLDRFDAQDDRWQEVVVEDRRAGPAEIAICRIDFASWLRLLTRRQRKIALTLASGETTTAAAKKFRVTQGAISQFRQRLRRSWERFQGEARLAAA